jgi:hypothetical protein
MHKGQVSEHPGLQCKSSSHILTALFFLITLLTAVINPAHQSLDTRPAGGADESMLASSSHYQPPSQWAEVLTPGPQHVAIFGDSLERGN